MLPKQYNTIYWKTQPAQKKYCLLLQADSDDITISSCYKKTIFSKEEAFSRIICDLHIRFPCICRPGTYNYIIRVYVRERYKATIKNTLNIIAKLLAISKQIITHQTSNDLTLYFHHRQEIINNGAALVIVVAANWK